MPESCIFCRIVAGISPAQILFQDEQVTAFQDAHPAAPTHILIVPNKHVESVNALDQDDVPLMGRLFLVAQQLAHQEGIDQSGYRLMVNTGHHGGQTVFHLHMHLLGGQRMRFPMG